VRRIGCFGSSAVAQDGQERTSLGELNSLEKLMQDLIFEKLSRKAFSHALFYNHSKALRFELSEGEKPIDKFVSAYKKAEEIVTYVLNDSEYFFVCLSFYGGKTFLSSMHVFRSLKLCEIFIPKDCKAWTEQEPEDVDNECFRHFIIFKVEKKELASLLWVAISSDLGIAPRASVSVYLISKEHDVILHPYDDRGMDVISTNNMLIKSLYSKFYHYLLKYDLEKMRSSISSLHDC
jgi:hypothetical protein